MLKIYGTPTHNTKKVLYVAESLGLDYEYIALDLTKGEQKTPEHLARHPFGKVPAIDHDGQILWESGAICRYLPGVAENTEVYPADPYARALVDQWMDFFSVHLGRWLGTVWFQRFLRPRIGAGEVDEKVLQEALRWTSTQLEVVDKHLGSQAFLTGDSYTIADAFAFAYVELTDVSDFSLADYPNVAAWYKRGKDAPPVQRAAEKVAS